MKTIFTKDELRKYALKKRTTISFDVSIRIVQKILNSSEFKSAKHIALYYPILHEVDLRSLLISKNKNFYLPRCNGNNLEFVKYTTDTNLKKGNFNILEPIGEKIDPKILDIIYIPALMANKKGYRLGYGKGYYDRFFLDNELTALKCVVLSNDLISNDFIEEKFDIQCDKIISA